MKEPKLKRVRMAVGQQVSFETEVVLEIRLANMTCLDTFLVLQAANSKTLGNPSFKKHHFQNPSTSKLKKNRNTHDLCTHKDKLRPYICDTN